MLSTHFDYEQEVNKISNMERLAKEELLATERENVRLKLKYRLYCSVSCLI